MIWSIKLFTTDLYFYENTIKHYWYFIIPIIFLIVWFLGRYVPICKKN